MRGARLLGLGTAVPPGVIRQAEALDFARRCCADETDADALALLRRFFARSRVETRHSVVAPPSHENPVPGAAAAAPVASDASAAFYAPRRQDDDRGPTTRQRMARFEREAPTLALAAARRALRHAAIDDVDAVAARITHLLTVSCTGSYAPGMDVALIRDLGLRPSVARLHVGFMGCHGLLNALRAASAFVAADPDSLALVCGVELCTLHFQYQAAPDRMLANALFGDGAAAVVVAPLNLGDIRSAAHERGESLSFSSLPHFTLVASASLVVPDPDNRVSATNRRGESMGWRVGDHGFEMNLSPDVPAILGRRLRPWLAEWLARHDLSIEAVRAWAVHPGGPKVLDAVQASLRLPDAALSASRDVLRRCGNMSSVTVAFILEALVADPQGEWPCPCVALGFGPGLSIEAALLR